MLKTVLLAGVMWARFASGQVDSSALRTQFGPPLDRETFRLSAGFDLIVDYGPHHQGCRAEVPAQMPAGDAVVSNSEVQARKMDLFLAALFPAAMRGREVGSRSMATGLHFLASVEYENLSVHRSNDTVVVQFKDAACR